VGTGAPNVRRISYLSLSSADIFLQMVKLGLDASSLAPLLSGQYLVESVQRYKPAFEVYHGLLRSLGKTDSPQDVWLISGYVHTYIHGALPHWCYSHRNPFDVTGARSVGMSAVWVNRAGKPWPDTLTPYRATKEATSLADLPGLFGSKAGVPSRL
jgi:2-haloacid dehalogenase